MTQPSPATPDTLATALQAHHLGLTPIRARVDGSKRPYGHTWEEWQSQRPTVEQLTEWFGNGHQGIGLVCGDISGNLEMLELEGTAVAGGVGFEVTRLAREAGIGELIERLRNGYYERTPSDGVHWLYRVDGDPVPGNTKLARRNATDPELADNPKDIVKTLIETRGEGGFTVIAPSHGPTHPTGKPWYVAGGSLDTIPTLTSAEREQLHAICRQLDTYAASKIVVAPVAQRIAPKAFAGHVGDSWVGAVVEHLAATETWDALLGRYGWRYLRQDRHGSDLWCRPGKDDGVGAWVKNDRLNVFSTSTPLDSTDRTTLDRLDVIAAYEHRGDRKEAARAVADATGIMDAWKRQRDTTSTPAPATAPPDTNTETGEITRVDSRNLPEEFWEARPSLQHIRQAAHSRTRCADSVLLFTLARVVAQIPPSVVLPAVTGSEASLNILGAIISSSGGGKSTAGGVARKLVPINRKDVVADVPPGSGEGLTELFFEWVMEEQPDGKNKKVKRQTKTGAFVYLDEGQALAEMGNRKGATLLPTLRSAWSGEVIGQSNASQETHRVLTNHSYRMTVMVGFQLEYAAGLIDDAPGGTPQRFVYASATDPTIPDVAPEWPGPLPIEPPPAMVPDGTEIFIDEEVATEIRSRNLVASRGTWAPAQLDTHRDLVRMKIAGALAYIDGGRLYIDAEDWRLSGMVMRTSDAVRGWIVEAAIQRASRETQVRNTVAAGREVHVAETLEQRALDSGSKSIGRKAHKVGDKVTKMVLKDAVASKHRAAASIDDMIAHAENMGWIRRVEGGWEPGESRPL
jgi:hypothetical protein